MIRYELKNLNGNLMPHFFAFLFPNLLSVILAKAIGSQTPAEFRQQVATEVMLSVVLVIPLSTMLLGYGALYSNEVEREIPLRMRLYGFAEKSLVAAKLTAHLIFMTLALLVYGIVQVIMLDIAKPKISSFIILLVSLYLIGIFFLVISHALSNIFRKFGITFGVEMFVYFVIMILTGMMGVRLDQLPEMLQKAARLLPMTYISNDFFDFWQGREYNFIPLVQSFLFLGAVTVILFLYSVYKDRRTIH